MRCNIYKLHSSLPGGVADLPPSFLTSVFFLLSILFFKTNYNQDQNSCSQSKANKIKMKSNPSIWGAKIRERPALHLVSLLCHTEQEVPVLISSPMWPPGSPQNEGSLQKQPSWPQFLNCLHHAAGDIRASVWTGGIFEGACRDKSRHTERRNRERHLPGWPGEGPAGVGAGCAGGSEKLKNFCFQKMTAQNSLFGLKTIFCSQFIILWTWCD